MKWFFAILVIINLIVFGSIVSRTIVLDTNNEVVSKKIDEPSYVNEEFILQPETLSSKILTEEFSSEQESPSKETRIEEKRSVEQEELPQTAEKKISPVPAIKSKESESKIAEIKSGNKNCTASIVLQEDIYHRIKGLLNQWPHVVHRDVIKNPHTGKVTKEAGDYWVVVSSNDNNRIDVMFNLLAKGYKPVEKEGKVFIARFDDRLSATKLSQKLNNDGFVSPILERKPEKIVGSALSITVYKIVFAELSKESKNKLAGILKPYGKLTHSTCQ